MAKYTEDEAKAFKISNVQKELRDGKFSCWLVSVYDDNGVNFSFKDSALSGDASKADIKGIALDRLQEEEKRVPSPVISYEDSNKVSDGETVG